MSLFRDEAPVLQDAQIELNNGAGAPTLAKVGVMHIVDVSGLAAAVAPVGQSVFVAPPNASAATGFLPLGTYRLAGAAVTYTAAGGAAAAVTITKDTGTTAAGAGTALLTGTIPLTGAANTTLNGTLVTNPNTLTLAAGDRLSFLFSGTLTGLTGCCITLYVLRV